MIVLTLMHIHTLTKTSYGRTDHISPVLYPALLAHPSNKKQSGFPTYLANSSLQAFITGYLGNNFEGKKEEKSCLMSKMSQRGFRTTGPWVCRICVCLKIIIFTLQTTVISGGKNWVYQSNFRAKLFKMYSDRLNITKGLILENVFYFIF